MLQTFIVDGANELTNVTRTGTFTLNGATPAPASSVTVNGLAAQTYGDFTFAATNLALANGANTFTTIAQNVYGVLATNIPTVNLPSSVNLAFDNNGNLTNDGARTFTYDSENQLTNVFVTGQWRSDFIYDGLNRRRMERDYAWQGGQWLKTNEVRYICDGPLPIQELFFNPQLSTNNPQQIVTYTRGLDLSGSLGQAGGIGGLLARTDTNGSTFYHADGAGNITALMDGGENIVARYLYNPFGKLIGQWGTMAGVNEMQFSSMPFQNLSGLSLYPYRAYNPNLQRWLNQDPIVERGGINLYGYVGNNPAGPIDPLGLEGNPISLYAPGLADGRWNSDPFGANGSFYGPGLFGPTPLPREQANKNAVDNAFITTFIDAVLNGTEEQREADEKFHQDHPNLAFINDALTFGASVEMGKFGEVPCESKPPILYRKGRPSPSNLKTRPGEGYVSFRDSLSNPWPRTGPTVFPPGADYFGIDTSQLAEGNLIYDNAPPGHVSVQGVSPDVLKNAVIPSTRGTFPE